MAASVPAARPELDAASRAELLEARGPKVHFGGVRAVDGVDLVLRKGVILGLIGPNGAGKTTLVNALSGFQKPTAGSVYPDRLAGTGRPPATPPPARRARA